MSASIVFEVLRLSERDCARSAWEEVAEDFAKLVDTLEALAAMQDDVSSRASIEQAMAAARRGSQLAQQQLNGSKTSNDPIARQS